jgi:hypothetical protein
MPISYLHGVAWAEITREERVFCAYLYQHIIADPKRFARVLRDKLKLPINAEDEWDAGYEVCFYRDLLDRAALPKLESGYPLKHTFDIALFSEHAIVIVEAKVHESFDKKQSGVFAKDGVRIRTLLNRDIAVHLVALASSRYFSAFQLYGKGAALAPFGDRRLSWGDLALEYGQDPLLQRAEAIYKPSPQRIADADVSK